MHDKHKWEINDLFGISKTCAPILKTCIGIQMYTVVNGVEIHSHVSNYISFRQSVDSFRTILSTLTYDDSAKQFHSFYKIIWTMLYVCRVSLSLYLYHSRCLFGDVRSQAQYKRSQGKNPLSSSDERFTFKLQFHCHRFSKCVSHKRWVCACCCFCCVCVRAKHTVIRCAVNI